MGERTFELPVGMLRVRHVPTLEGSAPAAAGYGFNLTYVLGLVGQKHLNAQLALVLDFGNVNR
jgi:hypothetical protein